MLPGEINETCLKYITEEQRIHFKEAVYADKLNQITWAILPLAFHDLQNIGAIHMLSKS